jgi:DNA modification methylase
MIYVFSKKGSFYRRIDMIDADKKESPNAKKKGKPVSCNVFDNHTRSKPLKQETGCPDGKRCHTTVLSIAKKWGKSNHPTEKPKELYKWLLERYCPAEGTVLDPTAGSFNSVVVAKELGLKGIGIEKDERFYKAAVERNKTPDPPETPLAE